MSQICFCAATIQSANLIRNGGFEKPVVGDGSFLLFNVNSSFTGWSVVGSTGNIGLVSTHFIEGGYTFPARSGLQWVDLTGNTNTSAGVQQTVATTPGQKYLLRFFVGNTYDASGHYGTTSTVNVLVNGVQIRSATNSHGAGTTTLAWQGFSVTFTAPTSMTTIAFLNGDPSTDNCNGLDAITLAPAAEMLAE